MSWGLRHTSLVDWVEQTLGSPRKEHRLQVLIPQQAQYSALSNYQLLPTHRAQVSRHPQTGKNTEDHGVDSGVALDFSKATKKWKQCSLIVKHTGPEAIGPGKLYTISVICVTLDKLTSLFLSFLICKMWIIMVLPHKTAVSSINNMSSI